jgi:hypothetical protein
MVAELKTKDLKAKEEESDDIYIDKDGNIHFKKESDQA